MGNEDITALNAQLEEQKAAAAELNHVVALIHEVLGSAQWSITYDEAGEELSASWSDGMRHLLGYENEIDFPNTIEAYTSKVHPDDIEIMNAATYGVLRSSAENKVISSRYRVRTKSGEYRWYRNQGMLKRRDDGTPERIYGVIMDITELESTQRELSEALEAATAVHEALGSGDWQMTFDQDGHMTSCTWSDRFRAMLGFESLEDFPNELESWTDRLHPDDKQKTIESYWGAVNDFTGATTYNVTYRILTKAGEYRWARATGRLTRRDDGTPKVFYGMFLDVDEQVKSSLRLREAQAEQEAHLEEVTALNSELEERQAQLEEAQAEQEAHIEEVTALNNELEERQAQLEEATAEQEAQIEEINALNAELESARDAADAANVAKTSFLFNMSHDIRTPMNAIVGFTELLHRHQDDPVRREDYLAKIDGASKSLLSIINNVLDMARIESGAAEIDEVPWSVDGLNAKIRDMFEGLMVEKELSFSLETRVQHHCVYADPTKLTQVMNNLLSNAYKYTEPGGEVRMLTEELESDRPGYVLFRTTVADTGVGMDADFLPRLFEEFSRESNTTESKVEGTGLGMPIVKRLVDLMGGTIEVASEKGVGTTFTVTLPHRIAESAMESAPVVETGPADFGGKRILLAEDNDLNAEIAIEILREADFEVERAEDGAVCVDMLRNAPDGRYDIILMDVQMPNMNGYEATRAIRALDDPAKAGIPILAMTANAFEQDKREALRAGMNGHLAKPIDVPELMRTLAGILT